METLLINFSGKAKRTTFNGRDVFVAPAVLLVGNNVLNGSRGPLLYPTDECGKNPGSWNGMPITNGHPTDDNGNAISAREPKTLEKWQLGTTFNDQWDGQKRTVDMYYDVEWTRNKSPETYQALLNSTPFDLSTGLGTKNHPVHNGSHINGTPYTHIARDYTPDHVASLVSQKGACDRSMGCGVNVTNGVCDQCGKTRNKEDDASGPLKIDCGDKSKNVEGECSIEQVKNEEPSLLRRIAEKLGVANAKDRLGHGSNKHSVVGSGMIPSDKGDIHVGYDASKDHVTISTKHPTKGETHQTSFKLDRSEKGEEGMEPPLVSHNPDTDHVTVTTPKIHQSSFKLDRSAAMPTPHKKTLNSGVNDMATKKESITYLTTNCSCHKGKDKVLNEYSDAELDGMVSEHKALIENTLVVNSLKEIPELKDLTLNEMPAALKKCVDPEEPDEDDTPKPKKKPTMNAEEISEKDWFEKAPQRIKDTFAFAETVKDQAKKQLVDRVVNAFAKNDAAKKALRPTYEGMTINQLQVIVENIAVPSEQDREEYVEREAVFNFLGNGGGYTTSRHTTNLVDEDDLLMPSYEDTLNAAKK